MHLERFFPKLAEAPYRVTSPPDENYNCVAWAAGSIETWWEPDPTGLYHWPPGVARELSIDAYIQAFRSLGYEPCSDMKLESGFEKVAIYAKGARPAHAARQLENGRWTSKLGEFEDIEHALEGLVGDQYGDVVRILRRPAKTR